MAVYKNFIRIEIISQIQHIAKVPVKRRSESIIRQFMPHNSPLSHIESNYTGALGEITVYSYFDRDINLSAHYEEHSVDSGDIYINDLI